MNVIQKTCRVLYVFYFFVSDKMVEFYLINIFVCLHGILSTFSNLLHTEHYCLDDVAI
jgi:uncharacterized membrane protein HdeD (DUF308 family)